ncbi:non-homologous end joining protein Ku [Cohnella nanjingensis]|uniref:Ku protein n=1 Tax=Cohnella nanjingensis TaxID=1387779 RepID=A0A7X0VEU0_9BACL|nr:Ku protein [Cohnella nanjingensis]MBB6671362.1 Ku protein [Cohnella nanjingensis]
MQAFWKGTVQIAKLQVPIKLYAATEEKTVSFRQQHRACSHAIAYQKYCAHCETAVEPAEVGKAYDLGGGQFIEIEESELKLLAPASDKTFYIEHFVRSADIEPYYMKKHYFIGMDEVGEQAFRVLHAGLFKLKRTGIGYITLRSVQQLAALWATKEGLMLTTLHYADEVRPALSAGSPAAGPFAQPELLEAFGSLVSGMSVPFDPTEYRNVYQEAVKRLIDAKIAHRIPNGPHPAPVAEDGENLVDFLSAVERSLAHIGQEPVPKTDKKAKRAKAAK